MNRKEELMYRIMGSIYEEQIPIIFKGALITKLVLKENGFSGLGRETKDIDANWVGKIPTMDLLTSTLDRALKKVDHLDAIPYRNYGERQAAGIKIIHSDTGEEVVKMDIDIKQIRNSRTYWYGDVNFRGVTIDQILCDKLSALSGDRIFRRIKDMVDVYALSKCVQVKTDDIFNIAQETGREIGSFDAFQEKQNELKHGYEKLKNIKNKPLFEEVYNGLRIFIVPFIASKRKMIWDAENLVWKKSQAPQKQADGLNPFSEDIEIPEYDPNWKASADMESEAAPRKNDTRWGCEPAFHIDLEP